MQPKQKRRLVPYDMVSPGWEAVCTGEKSSCTEERVERGPVLVTQDDSGNVIEEWSTWTWIFSGEEHKWDDDIRHINKMQAKLGPLDDNTRQIRAHIGSLVLCDSGVPVTIDELLEAIGRGELSEPSFRNGCWPDGGLCQTKGTQPRQLASMQTIHAILTGYLAGKPEEEHIS